MTVLLIKLCTLQIFFSSVQSSRSVVSDSLRPHGPQHTRPPCPSPTPGVHPNPCPLSQWCHPAISSSVFPFSSCPPSLPASGSFWISQLFAWGGQSTGVSASTSVLPVNTQDWFPLGWTDFLGFYLTSFFCPRTQSMVPHHIQLSCLLRLLLVLIIFLDCPAFGWPG